MASTPRTPRRGLPRVPGGEPWPPAGSGASVRDGADAAVAAEQDAGSAATLRSGAELADPGPRDAGGATTSQARTEDARPEPGSLEVGGAAVPTVRRGLPREPGGEPWPPASASPGTPSTGSARRSGIAAETPSPADPVLASDAVEPSGGTSDSDPAVTPPVTDAATGGVRRGLPRTPGGEPWPPASVAVGTQPTPESGRSDGIGSGASAGPTSRQSSEPGVVSAAETAEPGARATPAPLMASAPSAPAAPRPPLTVRRTVWPGAAARRAAAGRDAVPGTAARAASVPAGGAARPAAAWSPPAALRDYSPVQLLGSAAVLGVFALALVGIVVLLARFVLALGPGREFLAAFPGEYPLPASAPVGLPAWLNWSHFLNSFFLLLIIRTGWQVRREKRPSAFWSPRNNRKRRISLALWFHQALDILWIANGVVFVVLLFVTGQWMRIVPTSWEVFPNALSAALQYASLDWPTENGWVNYNSLQQLSYFAVTFVAAPLAIVSGVRLSGVWPKDADKLDRLYPAEWARKVHFPTMLFFVAFIVVHVALVLATGALRNLNHMYAARGSVDPEAFTGDPTGLLIFAASLVVMAAAWIAARPAVLVPIARLFGEVKQR